MKEEEKPRKKKRGRPRKKLPDVPSTEIVQETKDDSSPKIEATRPKKAVEIMVDKFEAETNQILKGASDPHEDKEELKIPYKSKTVKAKITLKVQTGEFLTEIGAEQDVHHSELMPTQLELFAKCMLSLDKIISLSSE